MTPLESALRGKIVGEGSITLEAYMEACNTYYYATRDPFGSKGDFTTAPEISQMFGEIIGAVLADLWRRAGSPQGAVYAELGGGRGTLASDAIRVMSQMSFSGEVHFVETSPILREAQNQAVLGAHQHESIDELPDQPLLLVANEFLDALPICQYVGGIERRVVIAGGGLAFDRDGEILELSPARERAVRLVAKRLVTSGGAALFIDYGHERSAAGKTLQAVSSHGFSPVLAQPGEQDLTSHVDFEIVSEAARDEGAVVTALVPQGEWLKRVGIDHRAQTLMKANPEQAQELASSLERLTAPDQMGELFKVIAIHSPDWPAPAGFQ